MLLALLSCALCLPSLDNGFHYDDSHVALNPHIRSLSEAGSLYRDFQTFSANPGSATFRPVLMLSALNYAVTGEAPAGYHAVNLLLHGLNAVLLFWALLAVLIDPRKALLGAVLCAVTSIHSEAVNYVSVRSELLIAFFFLAAFIAADAAYMAWTSSIIDRALAEPVRTFNVQLWTQLKAAVYYLALFALPVNLSVEHQFSVSRSPEVAVLLSSLLLLSLAAVVLRLKKLRILGFPVLGGRFGCCLHTSSLSLVLVMSIACTWRGSASL